MSSSPWNSFKSPMSSPCPFLLTPSTATANIDQNQQEPRKPSPKPDRTRLEPASTRLRRPTTNTKPSRSNVPKKPPQRGMGVAQLERLRLQERWKAITEANQLQALNLQHGLIINGSDVPVQPGAVNYGVPVLNGFASDRVSVDPYLGGAPDRVMRGEILENVDANNAKNANNDNMFEASRELSSMPKIMQQQQYYCDTSRCDGCFKKKRFNGEIDLEYNTGRRDKLPDTFPTTNALNFLGWNLENYMTYSPNANQVGAGFITRAARSAIYTNQNNAEVAAIDRKGNSTFNGNYVMEYDFFSEKSGKNSGSTSFKEMEFPTEASSVITVGGVDGGDASSCPVNSDSYSGWGRSSSNASNSIDLSLKLSY